MINSITDFLENGIQNLIQMSENFAQHPEEMAEYVKGIGKETNQLALNIIGETLTARNTMIRENGDRKEKRDIVRTDSKELITCLGTVQFQKEKGDLSVNDSGYKDNGVLGKLVYVYEGIEKEAPESKRHRLVNRHYFNGVYEGQMNRDLWKGVENYLEMTYDLSKVKRIYLNADGGTWIKAEKSSRSGGSLPSFLFPDFDK